MAFDFSKNEEKDVKALNASGAPDQAEYALDGSQFLVPANGGQQVGGGGRVFGRRSTPLAGTEQNGQELPTLNNQAPRELYPPRELPRELYPQRELYPREVYPYPREVYPQQYGTNGSPIETVPTPDSFSPPGWQGQKQHPEARGYEGRRWYPPPNFDFGYVKPRFQPEKDSRIPTLRIGDTMTHSGAPMAELDPQSIDATVYRKAHDSVGLVKSTDEDRKERERVYTGTSFFVNDTGLMATAYHVVEGAEKVEVMLADGSTRMAEVKAIRPTVDLALIQLLDVEPGERFPALNLDKNSTDLKRGDYVAAVGHPLGHIKPVISPGSLNRRQTIIDGPGPVGNENPNAIVLDASINIQAGNSGGPLLDQNGDVAGIVNFRIGSVKGQFVPVEELRDLVGAKDSPADLRSYFLPERLHFEEHARNSSLVAASSAFGVAANVLTRNSSSMLLRRATVYPHAAASAVYGLSQMPHDLDFLSNALEHGSTAEKASAIINVTSDGMLIGGPILTVASRFRGVGTALSLAGALTKLGNNVLADRKTY